MQYDPAKISNITPIPEHANDLTQIQTLIKERLDGIDKLSEGIKLHKKMQNDLKIEIKILQKAGKKLLGIFQPTNKKSEQKND